MSVGVKRILVEGENSHVNVGSFFKVDLIELIIKEMNSPSNRIYIKEGDDV